MAKLCTFLYETFFDRKVLQKIIRILVVYLILKLLQLDIDPEQFNMIMDFLS